MSHPALTSFDGATFAASVLSAAGLVVVDVYAQGCVPCRQLGRILSELSAEIPDTVRIGTLDAGANAEIAERYGVRSVPTLLFFKHGKVVETRTGVDRRQVLKKLIESHA